jgi:hypothetical protein
MPDLSDNEIAKYHREATPIPETPYPSDIDKRILPLLRDNPSWETADAYRYLAEQIHEALVLACEDAGPWKAMRVEAYIKKAAQTLEPKEE